jgi:Zn-dependent metalloprotease
VRRTLASTGIAVLLLGAAGVSVAGTAQAGTPQAAPKADKAIALARANQVLAQNRSAIRGVAGEQYLVKDTIVDASGATHVRYERTYQGLEVRGGDFVVHNAPTGSFAGASLAQQKPIAVSSIKPTLTPAKAVTLATKSFVGKISKKGAATLIVDATSGNARLAYKVNLQGFKADQTPSNLDVIIDANTGAYIDKHDQVEQVAGTGKSIYSGTVTVDTTQSGSTYQLKDPVRGNGYTCDLNGGTSTCSTPMTDADNVWGNGTTSDRASAAIDAHYGAAETYDYYKNVLGRAGVFGTGVGVPSRVHYGNSYVNAFWDGTAMNYGDGSGNKDPLVAIDVAGHEMSHGVTERTANLNYSGESGGLNEANSDIFGTMVEYYANNASDPGDYDIGEKINIFGNGKPLRYMYQPSLDGQSPDCWSSGVGNLDVHYSSGIGNHVYYLIAEGSTAGPHTSPTCGAPAVTGIGRDKAAKIWYRALSTYWVSTTNYKSARTGTLSAATDLYGKCGAEYQTLLAAWAAVNVTGTETCSTTPPTTPPPTTPPPAGGYYENATDVAIPDLGTGTSTISVTGRTGNAPATLQVKVDIKHTYSGDLVVDLIAPDGTVYNLQNRAGGSAANISKTFTVNASSEAANGTWSLRASDKAAQDSGKIDLWGLQF